MGRGVRKIQSWGLTTISRQWEWKAQENDQRTRLHADKGVTHTNSE